jgi:plasmid stability protein
MGDLNIRNVPDELQRALKVEAAESGKTLREICIDLLSFVLHRRGKVDSTSAQKVAVK